MRTGWIKIHRSMIDWEWYAHGSVKAVFLHLLLNANIENKKWKGIPIHRGEVFTSLSQIMFETGLSQFKVRDALEKLKESGEIIQNPAKKATHLLIVNFDKYQSINDVSSLEEHTKAETINTQETKIKKSQNNITKEEKNLKRKKDKNLSLLNLANEGCFEDFWQSYTPVSVDGRYVAKGSKALAKKLFFNILDKGETYEKIKRGLCQYINYCQNNQRQTCGVNVFLNQKRWLDDFDCSAKINVKSPAHKRPNYDGKIKAIAKLFD